jgi:hypothetical protein
LDENLVELKSVHHLEAIEVPNNNVSLEAHVGLLTGGDVFSSWGDLNNRNVIVVASKELLGTRDDVSNN